MSINSNPEVLQLAGQSQAILPAPGETRIEGDQRVAIAGVTIDNVTMAEAIARIESMILDRVPRFVVTPNVDHIVQVRRNEEFAALYREASLVLADGMPLIWASRFCGTPLKEKVSGADLFPRFCAVAATRGYRVFFMGGRPGAAQRSAELLTRRHPGLQVVGVECPPLGFEKDPVENIRLIERISMARPDVLFVGLGSPKGELWIHRHLGDCRVPVSIGVGAAFDFVAGLVRRAPVFMQRLGVEWLWRLMLEPRRMYRRYLVDDPMFLGLLWEHRKTRLSACQMVTAGEERP
jgi:N-acetylglucosaminyldiphosphoundecaprenol N-acetyl-beta-D-mannosaminyltransferase